MANTSRDLFHTQRLYPRLFSSFAIFLLCPSVTYAWRIAISVSTPMTPPSGFTITRIFFAVAVAVSIYFFRNSLVLNSREFAISKVHVPIKAIILLTFALLVFGNMRCATGWKPPPGIDPVPRPPLLGLSYEWRTQTLFLTYNLTGLLLTLSAAFIACRRSPYRKGTFIIVSILICISLVSIKEEYKYLPNALLAASVFLIILDSGLYWKDIAAVFFTFSSIYLLALIPIVTSNSIVHGFHRYSFDYRCEIKRKCLSRMVLRHALNTNETLPVINDESNLATFMQELDFSYYPHCYRGELMHGCPINWLYTAENKEFYWNTKFSGMKLDEVAKLNENACLIYCKQHKDEHFLSSPAELLASVRSSNPQTFPIAISYKSRDKSTDSTWFGMSSVQAKP